MYAHWRIDWCKVTFDGNGGTLTGPVTSQERKMDLSVSCMTLSEKDICSLVGIKMLPVQRDGEMETG